MASVTPPPCLRGSTCIVCIPMALAGFRLDPISAVTSEGRGGGGKGREGQGRRWKGREGGGGKWRKGKDGKMSAGKERV